ncbi:CoA transferase [Brevibacillus choshinensis]|nr:CoA transferase [Brevibacillus choshinensis]
MSALTEIKELDLSRLLPGPYCSLMLADYGQMSSKSKSRD